ncbi:four helix bundle protein [Prevotella sp. kh1p2]|uniref:four helix bundle protein n=1 Tax=Prevotella sp. kh1p2 TaxID=1761883 RepID=UPI0008B2D40E|nr:four helix bundle protein [Prevotella sp. kh1p2]SET17136.1 four helix bundle protein [Prevotella sp. kh1p2]SNU12071.1 four helix bundle protein [Prevotellaceae bacterium KH2P17]
MLTRKENIILTKTDAFSDRIIKLVQHLKVNRYEPVMCNQILRSGTSIGANTVESQNAQSRADFVNKLSIALKEADETQYWLRKLFVAGYIDQSGFASLNADNIEIIKLLTSIIKSAKGVSGL